jgi:nicotinate dehydrogenase subunit B
MRSARGRSWRSFAEVEIDRRSGKVWARKFTVTHVCGRMIEEVTFDRAGVTGTDWLSYPILNITEAPEAVDIVLIKRPELPPAGAGESSIRPVAAALANAVFDASGVRLRCAPLTPQHLKPALT